jgi:hypothetical protein
MTPTSRRPWTVIHIPHSSCPVAGFRVSLWNFEYVLLFNVDPFYRIFVTTMTFMHSIHPPKKNTLWCLQLMKLPNSTVAQKWSTLPLLTCIWFQGGTSASLANCLSQNLTPCSTVQGPQMSETYVLHVSICVVPNIHILCWVSRFLWTTLSEPTCRCSSIAMLFKMTWWIAQFCPSASATLSGVSTFRFAADHHPARTISIYNPPHWLTDPVLG